MNVPEADLALAAGGDGVAPSSLVDRGRRQRVIRPLAFALLAAMIVYGAVSTSGFLTWDNAKAILASMGFVGIIAVGMTLIMLSGNLFSLSLGTTAAVSAMAFLAALHWGVAAAIAAALVLGLVIGAAQGLVVGGLAADPIIITIAAGTLQAGAAAGLSGGSSIQPSASASAYSFLANPIGGIPFSIYVLVGLALLGELLLRRGRFGRRLYLVGDSHDAAFAAGLSVTRVTTAAFAVAGGCAAIAGVLIGAFNQNASLLLTGTYTYDAIAAAIVGGNAISGGRGSISRSILGALLIATLGDLMLLRNYSTGAQILVKGVVVVIFVAALNSSRLGERR